MVDLSRSPVEWYSRDVALGPKFATAFQEGQAAADLSDSRRTVDAANRQLMAMRAAEMQRTAADFDRLARADAVRMQALSSGATPAMQGAPSGRAAFIPPAADAYSLIAGFENFRPTPYDDMTIRNGQRVSAGLRTGYGSDTITRPDGSVVRVAPGMTVTQADAERDLRRRVDTEFGPRAAAAAGEVWGALPQPVKDALLSVTYNYGSLPQRIIPAVKSGNPEQIAAAIEALGTDNSGINRNRRAAEAAYIRQRLAQGTTAQAAPGAAPAPTPGLAIPALPSGALGEGFVTQSTGGVPTTVPDADLPSVGANNSQFVAPGPGGMMPVGAAPGVQGGPITTGTAQERAAAQRAEALRPQQEEAARQRALTEVATSPEGRAATELMEQGRLRNDREMFNRGLTQFTALAEAANARISQGVFQPAGPPVAGGSVAIPAAAPTVDLSRPIPGMLPGAMGIAPAGLSPVMAGGTQLPGALLPAPIAAQPQGLSTTRPAAPAAASSPAAEKAAADAAKLPPRYGVYDRAAVAREREALNRQLQFVDAELRYAIATRASTEVVTKLNEARIAAQTKSDMLSGMEAVSSLDAGDPRPIAEYFYRRTGGRLQLQQNPDNTYNVLDSGTVTQRNMSAAELARYARSDVDYRVRAAAEEQKKVQATRQAELDKSNLRITEKLYEIRAELVKARSLEQHKADLKKVDPKLTVQDGQVYILDPERGRLQIGRVVTTDRTDPRKQLPKGQSRIELLDVQTSAVPTR